MSRYAATIRDESDSLGLDFVDIAYVITYTVEPGDPGCRYTSNGDGWPAIAPSVERDSVEIASVLPTNGAALCVPMTRAWLVIVKEWAERQIEKQWETIEADILANEVDIRDEMLEKDG